MAIGTPFLAGTFATNAIHGPDITVPGLDASQIAVGDRIVWLSQHRRSTVGLPETLQGEGPGFTLGATTEHAEVLFNTALENRGIVLSALVTASPGIGTLGVTALSGNAFTFWNSAVQVWVIPGGGTVAGTADFAAGSSISTTAGDVAIAVGVAGDNSFAIAEGTGLSGFTALQDPSAAASTGVGYAESYTGGALTFGGGVEYVAAVSFDGAGSTLGRA